MTDFLILTCAFLPFPLSSPASLLSLLAFAFPARFTCFWSLFSSAPFLVAFHVQLEDRQVLLSCDTDVLFLWSFFLGSAKSTFGERALFLLDFSSTPLLSTGFGITAWASFNTSSSAPPSPPTSGTAVGAPCNAYLYTSPRNSGFISNVLYNSILHLKK